MCYERGLSAIHLEEADRIAQIEFIQHTDFVSRKSGIDPFKDRDRAVRDTYDSLDLDMIWATWDPIHPWDLVGKEASDLPISPPKRFFGVPSTARNNQRIAERTDSWSKAFPTTWRTEFNIRSVEDVLDFDPENFWEIPNQQELEEYFREEHTKVQSFYRNQLVPGGKYQTCFMWLIMAFGLELAVKATYRDPKGFEKLLKRFGSLSHMEFKAWAQTEIRAFISHDDICSTSGPFFSPKWLRRNVFPWYERLWSELRSKGIAVLFCSDGNMTTIVDEIAEAGADGFILEECCDLARIAEKYGKSKVIVGGVDIGVLTYGTERDVEEEVKRCIRSSGKYPGYFMNVSGSIPDNVPLGNLEAYFDTCKKYCKRPIGRL